MWPLRTVPNHIPSPLHSAQHREMSMGSHSPRGIREGFPEKEAFESTAGPQRINRICAGRKWGRTEAGAMRLQNQDNNDGLTKNPDRGSPQPGFMSSLTE